MSTQKTKKRTSLPTTKQRFDASSRKSKKPRHSALGKHLIDGLGDIAAWARGELVLRTDTIRVPDDVDVAAVRRVFGLTQREFAARYLLDISALRAWEQKRRRPDPAARAYLTVIAKEPSAVRRALGT
jgi:putative transcriptional regulator